MAKAGALKAQAAEQWASHDSDQMSNIIAMLALLYLMNFRSKIISCDLQRIINKSTAVRHVLLFTVIFLFTTSKDGASLKSVLRDAVLVYVLYLFASKAKAYFVIPTLLLLMVNQICQIQLNHLDKMEKKTPEQEKHRKILATVKSAMAKIIVGLVVVGMIVYLLRQYQHFGKQFDIVKFFFDMNCQK